MQNNRSERAMAESMMVNEANWRKLNWEEVLTEEEANAIVANIVATRRAHVPPREWKTVAVRFFNRSELIGRGLPSIIETCLSEEELQDAVTVIVTEWTLLHGEPPIQTQIIDELIIEGFVANPPGDVDYYSVLV